MDERGHYKPLNPTSLYAFVALLKRIQMMRKIIYPITNSRSYEGMYATSFDFMTIVGS